MWREFDGTARNREQTLERINALKWTDDLSLETG